MAELIPVGTTQVDSPDFTLGKGESATLSLTEVSEGTLTRYCQAAVQKKTPAGVYTTLGVINGTDPVRVLQAEGTFRVRRLASGTPFGVAQG